MQATTSGCFSPFESKDGTLIYYKPMGFGLPLSPDEQFLIYGQLDQTGSDLMLVENFH